MTITEPLDYGDIKMGQATEEYQRIASSNLPSRDGEALVRAIQLTQSKCRRFVQSLITPEHKPYRGRSVHRSLHCCLEIHRPDEPPVTRAIPLDVASECLWLLSALNGGRYTIVEETFAPDIDRALVSSTHTTLLEVGPGADTTVQIDVSANWVREKSTSTIRRTSILVLVGGDPLIRA